MGNSMKSPAHPAGANVVRAYVAGSTRQPLRDPAADYQQVLVDYSRSCQDDGLFCGVATDAFSQIDTAMRAETGDGRACSGVQGVHEMRDRRENAFFAAFSPVRHPSVRPAAGYAGVEPPD